MTTPDELATRCDWIAAHKARLFRETGTFRAELFFGKGPGPIIYRLRNQSLIDESLNNRDSKTILYALIRHLIEAKGYDCFIMATDAWCFIGNEHYYALNDKQQRALVDRGFSKLEKLGYGTRAEVFHVNGQTPNLYHQVSMYYKRRPPEITSIESMAWDVLRGRATMWGDFDDNDLRHAYDRLKNTAPYFVALGVDLMPTVDISKEKP